MDAEQLLESFANIRMFARNGKRAPHKPLLLLIALARVQRGEPRLVTYAEIQPLLKDLLRRYWSTRSAHPHYPFWHLQADDLWEVPERAELQAASQHLKRSQDVPERLLLEGGARGGLPPILDAVLRGDPALVNRVCARLLQDHFPPSMHEDLLDAVGMPWVAETARRNKRDPDFRPMILRAYEYRCAVCGYDGRLGEVSLGLEAAHIKWHAAGGPDEGDNGIALCCFHHKVFDLGAIGVDADLRVLVSADVNGRERADEWIGRFAGRSLLGPRAGSAPPRAEYLDWHLEQVFRDPCRPRDEPA
jgi:putative restriction endonuclease